MRQTFLVGLGIGVLCYTTGVSPVAVASSNTPAHNFTIPFPPKLPSKRAPGSVKTCSGQPLGTDAFIGGPNANVAAAANSAVLGGSQNQACTTFSSVAGGNQNLIVPSTADGFSFIGGGLMNTISGPYTFIGAGGGNAAPGFAAAIVTGVYNTATGSYAVIGGGADNNASGQASSIGAGGSNTVTGSSSAIASGAGNLVSGAWSSIDSGIDNHLGTAVSFLGSGEYNHISPGTVGGGLGAADTAIVSGFNNSISALVADGARYGFIGGGHSNTLSAFNGVIAGGASNTARGDYSVVPGGINNSALGVASFAGGTGSQAIHNGTFLWSDDAFPATTLKSLGSNEFLVRASGGVGFFTNASLASGVELRPGSGTWSSLSDRASKTNIVALNSDLVLAKVEKLPITRWSYRTQDASIQHVGPMAQDFYAAFGVGDDDRHITSIDEDGIALAAIKALAAKNLALTVQVQRLEAHDATLASRDAVIASRDAVIASRDAVLASREAKLEAQVAALLARH